MIFVTVGTTSFNTLIKAIDETKINDKVIIQKSDGSYLPKNYEFFEYTNEIKKYYSEAEIIITHGGAGSIFKLVGMGKKVIGVANEERTDKHQSDILKKMADENYLIWCKDLTKINEAITKAKKTNFKKYTPPECNIAEYITEFLN